MSYVFMGTNLEPLEGFKSNTLWLFVRSFKSNTLWLFLRSFKSWHLLNSSEKNLFCCVIIILTEFKKSKLKKIKILALNPCVPHALCIMHSAQSLNFKIHSKQCILFLWIMQYAVQIHDIVFIIIWRLLFCVLFCVIWLFVLQCFY